jgi:hypothetical protein
MFTIAQLNTPYPFLQEGSFHIKISYQFIAVGLYNIRHHFTVVGLYNYPKSPLFGR